MNSAYISFFVLIPQSHISCNTAINATVAVLWILPHSKQLLRIFLLIILLDRIYS